MAVATALLIGTFTLGAGPASAETAAPAPTESAQATPTPSRTPIPSDTATPSDTAAPAETAAPADTAAPSDDAESPASAVPDAAAAAVAGFFVDVTSANPFFAAINWMGTTGLSTGYARPDGTREYRPSLSVSREAMAAFLYRYSGDAFTPPSKPSFSDVPTTSPFYTEIEWLKAEGITTGNADGTFRPSDPISRQAMSAFLARYDGAVLPTAPTFTDVTPDNPFALQIEWMRATGISTGLPDGSFAPIKPVTREAMAAFLYRLDGLTDFTATPKPILSGTPETAVPYGSTVPAWTPAAVEYSYQWNRDGTLIPGATAADYTPVAADIGHVLSVRVVGARIGTDTADAVSVDSPVVIDGAAHVGTPVLPSSAELCTWITGTAGEWGPIYTVTRQWQIDGVDIPGETGLIALVNSASVGKQLTLLETGTTADGVVKTSRSAAVVPTGKRDLSCVAGRVVDQLSGAPLANVNIGVFLTNPEVTTTDQDGRYLVRNTGSTYKQIYFRPTDSTHARTMLPVPDADQLGSHVLDAAIATSRLSGRLTTNDGIPLAGIFVTARTSTLDYSRSMYTDANGEYRLGGLPVDDDVTVTARIDSEAVAVVTPAVFRIAPNASVTGVDFRYSTAVISGHVTRGGVPAAGAYVSAGKTTDTSERYATGTYARTDANGDYTILIAPRGDTWVKFESYGSSPEYWKAAGTLAEAQLLSTSAGETISGIDADLVSASLSGVATAGGKPVSGVAVNLRRITPGLDGHLGNSPGQRYTAADGSYSFENLDPGQYTLEFGGTVITEFWKDAATRDSATTITIQRGQSVTGVNPVLTKK